MPNPQVAISWYISGAVALAAALEWVRFVQEVKRLQDRYYGIRLFSLYLPIVDLCQAFAHGQLAGYDAASVIWSARDSSQNSIPDIPVAVYLFQGQMSRWSVA